MLSDFFSVIASIITIVAIPAISSRRENDTLYFAGNHSEIKISVHSLFWKKDTYSKTMFVHVFWCLFIDLVIQEVFLSVCLYSI